MQEVTRIAGNGGGGGVRVMFGTGDEPDVNAPMLVGAESGFACFDGAISDAPDAERKPLLGLANSMRASSEGMWLALAEGGGRRFGLVQSNRGIAQDRPGFYESHHGHTDGPVWRDYYYRAAYFLLDRIDQEWGSSEVVVHHLTGHGWPEGLAPAVLEAAGNLLDTRQVALERLIFTNGTCGLKDPSEIEQAAAVLSRDEQHGHRPIEAKEHPPGDLGYDGPAPVRLFKVDVGQGLGGVGV